MSMAMAAGKVKVCVTRRFPFAAGRVFDAWLDADNAGRWFFATPAGQMVACRIDARVGGRFTMTDRRDGVDVEHVGEYLELERPRRIVFRFGVPQFSPGMDRVEIDIVPLDDGGCELTLTHWMDAAWAEHSGRAQDGWAKMLGMLEGAL
ncbi:SRPBCC family protein [Ferrovibrio sp.]|uniref:SRPBCC family protein n=1 Tax=Ferrovibrio sp. TaxID=1917215 RepID=UPI00260977F5|nr:SRPBCC family protein [Ferrovibrio sp.]